MDLIDASAKFLEIAGRVSAGMGDAISSRELEDRLSRIPTNLGPYGVDPFGFDPQYLKRYLGLGAWVYRKYFRCESFGVQNLPDGPALVIANHSGQLPYDGAMISMATFLDREPPRFLTIDGGALCSFDAFCFAFPCTVRSDSRDAGKLSSTARSR